MRNNNMKLLNTGVYLLLLIQEEAEIKGGSELSFYKNNHGSEVLCISYLSKTGVVFHELDVDPVEEYGSIEGGLTPLKEDISKIVAYYPLTKEAKELDLLLLPNPFEKEIDVEELACTKYNVKDGIRDYDERYYNTINVAKAEAFIEGYKAAQSTQQLPEEFIPEYEFECCNRYLNCKGCDATSEILNKRLKTTTNSEGKEEIQGTYKY